MALGNEANIKAVITADDRASSVVKGFGSQVDSMGASVVAKGILIADAIEAAGKAVIGFGIASVKAFSESEELIAQTNTVLKSTGNIAGVTADQVTKLATALQKTTKYSDEDVRSAENLLLTFTSIGKDIFPDATKVVLDMSTALGQDLKSSSIQLGKALQDPVRGITALRRVGVNFNDAQQDTISKLVETNQLAKAQGMILQELQREFGGSAEAAGNTFGGALARLKNQFNDVQEIIGQTISERLGPFVAAAAAAIASIDWSTVVNRTITALSGLGNWLAMVSGKIVEVGTQVAAYLIPKFEAVWNTIVSQFLPAVGSLVAAIGPTVGAGLVWAIGFAADTLNVLLQVATPVFNFLSENTAIVWALVAAFAAWKAVLVIDAVISAFQAGMAIMRSETLLTTGVMSSATGAAGGLRVALLGLLGPWEIILGIVGVAAVIEGIRRISNALDDLMKKWAGAGKTKVGGGNIEVDSNSDLGLTQRFINAFKGGFATGGYTGSGGVNDIAGVVHKGEYVLPQSMVNQSTGLPKMSSGTETHVNITLQAGAFMGTDAEARKFAKTVLIHLKDMASMKNTTVANLLEAS
jgi:hypothetical protein